MTRPELHALVDIVMDARERGKEIEIRIDSDATMVDWGNHHPYHIYSSGFDTFSDFTQAVKEYIKTLENK